MPRIRPDFLGIPLHDRLGLFVVGYQASNHEVLT